MKSLLRVPVTILKTGFDVGRAVVRHLPVPGLGQTASPSSSSAPVPDTAAQPRDVRPEPDAPRAAPAAAAPPAPEEIPVSGPLDPYAGHVDTEEEQVASFGPAADVGASIEVAEPWDGYGSWAAKDVVDRLVVADPATKAAVALYEGANRKRSSVLKAAAA